MRGILKKALLLFKRNMAVVDEYEPSTNWKVFVLKHSQIDRAIQHEKIRAKLIHRVFFVVDIVITICLLSTQGFLWHKLLNFDNSDSRWHRVAFALELFPTILEVLFTLLLTISACYIASYVRGSTGKKQNTCLLIWHVFNLLILIIITLFIAIFIIKQDPSFLDEGEDPSLYRYYDTIAVLAYTNI